MEFRVSGFKFQALNGNRPRPRNRRSEDEDEKEDEEEKTLRVFVPLLLICLA